MYSFSGINNFDFFNWIKLFDYLTLDDLGSLRRALNRIKEGVIIIESQNL